MVESAILALAAEVEGQPEALNLFARRRLKSARRDAIFVGAGDSYAAALAGFYASKGRCLAVDPYVLASSPEIADGADVYLISVSGRTASNVLAAVRVGRHAKRTTAITAAPESRLARVTDSVIGLPMEYLPRTSGALSFTLSLVAVLKLVGRDDPCDFALALREAKKERLRFAGPRGTTYYLGNSFAYVAAFYAAAKTYEILGSRAQAELLEEFSHLELFSLTRSDVVNCFASFDPSGIAGKLNGTLEEEGYNACLVRSWGRTDTERLFYDVFLAQISALEEAKKRRLTAPKFLTARGALRASDAMIY